MASTHIFVSALKVEASIGVHPHEYETTQPILVDINLDMGDLPSPETDHLAETYDYAKIAEHVETLAGGAHVQLVETLAHRIADWALQSDERIRACTVKITKPHALINAGGAGVELSVKRDGQKQS